MIIKKIIVLLSIFAILPGVSQSQDADIIVRDDFEQYFKEARVTGGIVLYNLQEDEYLIYNKQRVHSAFIPASTFEIMLALMALDTGVIQDEKDVIQWDGMDRDIPVWNADHNLRSAINYSVVWFFKELARRIGLETMQQYLKKAEYGNMETGGGIDSFWLTGDLRINPMEQVEFLVKLYKNELPFSRRSMEIVKKIIFLEQTDDYTLSGKSGWDQHSYPQVGWFVGYIENESGIYFIANSVDILQPGNSRARLYITMRILGRLGMLGQDGSGQ